MTWKPLKYAKQITIVLHIIAYSNLNNASQSKYHNIRVQVRFVEKYSNLFQQRFCLFWLIIDWNPHVTVILIYQIETSNFYLINNRLGIPKHISVIRKWDMINLRKFIIKQETVIWGDFSHINRVRRNFVTAMYLFGILLAAEKG